MTGERKHLASGNNTAFFRGAIFQKPHSIKKDATFFVYVLQCADGTLYTGYTDNVDRRIKAHNEGKAAKYTSARRPVKLLASWEFSTKSEAMRAEYAFKQLSRNEKLEKIGFA